MTTESIGSMNSLSDTGNEDATAFESTGDTAPSTDDTSQQPDTAPSSAEEGIPANLEGAPESYGSPTASAGPDGQASMPEEGEPPNGGQFSEETDASPTDALQAAPLPDTGTAPSFNSYPALSGAPCEAPSGGSGAVPSDASGEAPSDSSGAEPSDASGEAPSDSSGAEPSDASGEAPSDSSGAEPSDASGEAPSDSSGTAPSDDASTEQAGDEGNGAADGEVTNKELRDNPQALSEAGMEGLEVTGMELTLDSNGMLSEGSKEQVNELVGYLTDAMGGIEVVANVYEDDNGNIGAHFTSGDNNSVTYYPMEGTVYSVHTHPGGSTTPSQTDLDYEIAGAEDAIIPADGVAGNEDGSDYYVYSEAEDGQGVASEVSETATAADSDSSEPVTLDG
ncbi:MAG: hypothetical protein PVI89_05480 [Desulfobacteraceae bacterium]|jgi:proteasome lid subunit RPN8/RPN11